MDIAHRVDCTLRGTGNRHAPYAPCNTGRALNRRSEVHAPGASGAGLRTVGLGTILGVLKACDRDRENVRITIRHDGIRGATRIILLPASLSRYEIRDIVAQNVADALPSGATAITIERVSHLIEVGI